MMAEYRMLVADDDSMIRDSLSVFIRGLRDDVGVDTVGSGEELVETAADEPYDLIMTDYDMNGMNGADAIREIRGSHGPNQNTSIVLMSGNRYGPDGTDRREEVREFGNVGFYEKPIDLDRLGEILNKYLPKEE